MASRSRNSTQRRLRSASRTAIGAACVVASLTVLSACYGHLVQERTVKTKPGFIHVVFFWLKDGTTAAQKQQLIDDCKNYLGTVRTVLGFEVGPPAGTPREVVDNSFGVCFIAYFDDKAGQDYYQKAEKHLQFIERNKDHWERVQVYDMIPVKNP